MAQHCIRHTLIQKNASTKTNQQNVDREYFKQNNVFTITLENIFPPRKICHSGQYELQRTTNYKV